MFFSVDSVCPVQHQFRGKNTSPVRFHGWNQTGKHRPPNAGRNRNPAPRIKGKDNIRVVVLNACFSRPQAAAITEVIDCAIGMNSAIGDKAAIVFAAAFYQALGFERSVKDAFESGKAALMLEGIPEEKIPELLVRKGVNPRTIFLIEPTGLHVN
jgi:hypothetical protein